MPIKNYTSTVKPAQTIMEIEQILLKHGVRQMHKNYDADGEIVGVYFTLPFGERMVHYKLPARIEQVEQIMRDDPKVEPRYVKNARCVAWRIVKDWIDSQLAMVQASIVDLHQVFLPYAVDPNTDETLYDKFVQGNMPNLLTD